MKTKKATILLVDDEPDILEFIGYNLEKEGYRTLTASNGKEAIKITKKEQPDLILLDLMMPELDGIETCELIRADEQLKDSFIVFLTARSEDYSQIAGYNAGADDYITKPVKPKVLTSKIKALIRRIEHSEETPNIIEVQDLKINQDSHLVEKAGRLINLPKKEFSLLCLLASVPNKVFERDEILDKVWGKDVIVGERTIDVHIRKLRKKLGNEMVQTIKGVGYKLVTE
ncbi:two-component system alkaline phosphatase synthesis response regulator PhoP [Balneicella halophila]|uniref:Phosphate regulon transcriptional regulatory protein PhoB n=1 Tax=Balneicella halophila TaxID=1537566 RepID=A0A7L4US19_BALHA|nr:response regulator transcription factor [Balneicella halophila]PVX52282.1 two-component system alkaline phosphatase synthesis response regulator PhoP [Balneicella halophila]